MKRLKSIFIILSVILVYFLIFRLDFEWECIFKKTFNIACPGCGLTRSFRNIFELELGSAIKYNILGIPLFIGIIISIFILIKDIIKNENTYFNNVYSLVSRYCILIFVLLIVTMIINNINGL